MSRQPRTVARNARLTNLSECDLQLLELLGVLRYATTEQVARSGVAGLEYAKKRLRRLLDGGLTRVFLRTSREPSLHRLSPKGLATLLRFKPELEGVALLPGLIEAAAVPHHLMLIDLRLYATELGRHRSAPLSRWTSSEPQLGLEAERLRPDALATFDTPGGRVTIAIEADLGTESAAVILTKAEKYRRVADTGLLDAVWFGVPTAARARTVAEQLERAGLGGWARVLTAAHLVARPVRELPERGRATEGHSALIGSTGAESSTETTRSSVHSGVTLSDTRSDVRKDMRP